MLRANLAPQCVRIDCGVDTLKGYLGSHMDFKTGRLSKKEISYFLNKF